jgi:hypothetical protein
MGVDELLAEIEGLTHHERCRRLVEVAGEVDRRDLGG